MQLGMIGLGRMGANMVRRLSRDGHTCVVFDADQSRVMALQAEGSTGAESLEALAGELTPPRSVWIMLPADLVDGVIDQVAVSLEPGDIVIDGGNSHYHKDFERAERLGNRGIHYVDVGISGGVHGLERGYCQMIGGEAGIVRSLEPLWQSLAPGADAAERTAGRNGGPGDAERGYLHCGTHGAGHFVKMIHNGIEYGMMAAYAEGLQILANADVGTRDPDGSLQLAGESVNPAHYPYSFDIAEITELWRRGSVVTSWLLDLTAQALHEDPELAAYAGRVGDSGEGRWTIQAAVDEGVPAHVLTAALYQRFSSRGNVDFGNRVLSAMRRGFGGHVEKG